MQLVGLMATPLPPETAATAWPSASSCTALQPGAASSGGGRGALAAAAAREAAMRAAFLCLARRALSFSRFVEPVVSPSLFTTLVHCGVE